MEAGKVYKIGRCGIPGYWMYVDRLELQRMNNIHDS